VTPDESNLDDILSALESGRSASRHSDDGSIEIGEDAPADPDEEAGLAELVRSLDVKEGDDTGK
jgi:hypothetical protein